ncbi:Transposase DDE domain-containing protein [Paracoccus seriniphilus]|uniref:Transposase DDE domain-containing protein n=1 Tax=Paracoccus seriniphilus TaxID=184748 RepID=A0A239PNH0_9RHOB|nr:Transposase DDE domain-containing protein [Paracoccus seriniphilus]
MATAMTRAGSCPSCAGPVSRHMSPGNRDRTARHEGFILSQKHRKKIEKAFGRAKTVGGMAQAVYRGVERVRSRFILTMAANNLARLPRLLRA